LARYIGGESAKAVTNKRHLSHNIANTIEGKNPRALRRPNKNKKHNSNIFKDKDNRPKRLALLGRGLSK
jgi:hypothetical protein